MNHKFLGIFIFATVILGGYSLWSSGVEAATTVGSDRPSFQADLKNTLDLQAGVGKSTFTRATVATVTDFEGLIKNVKSGEARFEGARRVENQITFSEDVTQWSKIGTASTPNATTMNLPAVFDGIFKNGTTYTSEITGRTFIVTATLSGSGTIYLRIDGNAGQSASVLITLTSTPTRYSLTILFPSTTSTYPQLVIRRNDSSATATTVIATKLQLEDVTGQANQNPSEYVSTNVKTATPYHGANVDGVKYFTTQNGNTVASNIVTEATGAAIPDATLHGYVAEGARTNLALQSETLGTTWTASNVTVANNSVVAPSGATTAETLTASAGNGTLSQPITGTAASYTFSVYLKRLTGTGAVSISADGTTFTTCTINSSTWTRCTDTRTLTVASYNQTIKIATNADAVYAWGAQSELGAFASSYIPTTTASVTRNADVLSYPSIGNMLATTGSIYAEASRGNQTGTVGLVTSVNTSFLGGIELDAVSGARFTVSGNDASTQADIQIGTSVVNTLAKYASRWATNSAKAYFNGTNGTQDNSVIVPTTIRSTIDIGERPAGSIRLFGTIRNVKIWKKALTDTQLTNMTSTNTAVAQSAVRKTIVKQGSRIAKINVSQNTKLTNGLVGMWSFNGPDVSGVTAYDRSGQGNNGTLTGGVTKAIGKVGQALSFDGTSGYVGVGDINSLNASTALTVSAWVYKTGSSAGASTAGTIAGKWNDSVGAGWFLEVLDSDNALPKQIRFYISGVSTASTYSIGQVSMNAWHHLLVKYDGAKVYIYVDGVLDTSPNITGTPTTSTDYFQIGFDTGSGGQNNYFNGKIDEVRIYNRALSATEVTQLYNLGR